MESDDYIPGREEPESDKDGKTMYFQNYYTETF